MGALDELSLDPTTALPRSNGELVFSEPWESRAFGMAAALADSDLFSWKDFQAGLVAAIGDQERRDSSMQPYRYYERWLAALEALVVKRGLVAPEEIDERVAVLLCRADGHDHRHDHDHDDNYTRP